MVNIIKSDPTDPYVDLVDRRQSLLPANATKLEHAVVGITAKLEPIPVPFDSIWDVDKAPDSLLPFLAYAWSVDEWNDGWSEAVQRKIIKDSVWVHQRKGTLGAVKRALESMGYESTITEWFNKSPEGTPGTFSIEVVPNGSLIADSLLQIRAMIDAVKRLSAHYDVAFGINIPAVVCAYSVPLVGVEITVTD